jgi:transcriptional regulator with XRE-family HTH domain
VSATATATAAARRGFDDLLRRWRNIRGLSQLQLSAVTGVSTRHLSFLETGRALPTRQIVLFLAEPVNVLRLTLYPTEWPHGLRTSPNGAST